MRIACFEPVGLLIVCATASLVRESWAMEHVVGKTMHLEPEGLSPGSAKSGLCVRICEGWRVVMNGRLASLSALMACDVMCLVSSSEGCRCGQSPTLTNSAGFVPW